MATKVLGRAVLVPQGDWNPSKQYITLDLVHYSASNGGDGCSYVAKSNNIGIAPAVDSSVWFKITDPSDINIITNEEIDELFD